MPDSLDIGLAWRVGPVWLDRVIAGLLLVEMEIQLGLNQHAGKRVLEAVLAVLLAAAVALRRRWPLGVLAGSMAAAAVFAGLGAKLAQHTMGPIVVVPLLFYAGGAFLPERRGWLALGLGLALYTILTVVATPSVANVVFDEGMLGAVPWALGRMVRLGAGKVAAERELAERIDAEREQYARVRALGERARIARELHDVITHSVSVMVIQAGGARVVMYSDPDRAERSLRSVELVGREAIAEMRRLLGLLGDGQDPRALAPQPGLADVPALIDRACSAGLAAKLRVEGQMIAISPGLDLTAYRIVQEALTNSVKHAGQGPTQVSIRWNADALELEVSDEGPGRSPDRTGPSRLPGAPSGHGVPGMRERVALQGGTIDIGPRSDGGFQVRACLPLARGAG